MVKSLLIQVTIVHARLENMATEKIYTRMYCNLINKHTTIHSEYSTKLRLSHSIQKQITNKLMNKKPQHKLCVCKICICKNETTDEILMRCKKYVREMYQVI